MIRALLLVFLLTGCEGFREVVNEGAEKTRKAADTSARLWIQTPCLITLGGAQRELTPRERELAQLIAQTSCRKNSAAPPLSEEEVNALPAQ